MLGAFKLVLSGFLQCVRFGRSLLRLICIFIGNCITHPCLHFTVAIAIIYISLIGLSVLKINKNKKILAEFDSVQMEFDNYNGQFSKLRKQKREMDKSLELGKLVNSNQVLSYKALAQYSAVNAVTICPRRVQLTEILILSRQSNWKLCSQNWYLISSDIATWII